MILSNEAKAQLPEESQNVLKRLLSVAQDTENFLGVDSYDNVWFQKVTEKGEQVWVCVRDRLILNGGFYKPPRNFDSYSKPLKDIDHMAANERAMDLLKDHSDYLTYLQGFIAMQKIVEMRYRETNSGDFGFLAGMVQLCADGAPADLAAWSDWLEAIDGLSRYISISYDKDNQVYLANSDEIFTREEAYKAMEEYLKAFAARGENGDIAVFLKELAAIDDVTIDSNPWLKLWVQAVQEASEGKKIPCMQLRK